MTTCHELWRASTKAADECRLAITLSKMSSQPGECKRCKADDRAGALENATGKCLARRAGVSLRLLSAFQLHAIRKYAGQGRWEGEAAEGAQEGVSFFSSSTFAKHDR